MNVFDQMNGARPIEAIWRYEDVRALVSAADEAPAAPVPMCTGGERWWAGMPLLWIACRMQAGRLVATSNRGGIVALTQSADLPETLGG
ncbi:MAG: hypothetical protein ACYDCQ_16455 [Dehalococcoidia bacterium]